MPDVPEGWSSPACRGSTAVSLFNAPLNAPFFGWRLRQWQRDGGCLNVILWFTLLVSAAALAQDPSTFKTKVNVVLVPVVVRDAAGRPVGNLTQEDFQIFD